MIDPEAFDLLVRNLQGWTDADLFKLRESINDEIARRIYGPELEAKAKAAERMYDD